MQQNRILQLIALVLLLFASTFAICEEQEDVDESIFGVMKIVKVLGQSRSEFNVLGKTDGMVLFQIKSQLRCVNLKLMQETWTIDLKREDDDQLFLEYCLLNSATLSMICSSSKKNEQYAMIYKLEKNECRLIFMKTYSKRQVVEPNYFARANISYSTIQCYGKWIIYVCNGTVHVVDIEKHIPQELNLCPFRINETCFTSKGVFTLNGKCLTEIFDFDLGKQTSTNFEISKELPSPFRIMEYHDLIICLFPKDLLAGMSADSSESHVSQNRSYLTVLNSMGEILHETGKGTSCHGCSDGRLFFLHHSKDGKEICIYEYIVSTKQSKTLMRFASSKESFPIFLDGIDDNCFFYEATNTFLRIFQIDDPIKTLFSIKCNQHPFPRMLSDLLFLSGERILAGKNIDKICEALGLEFEVCKQEKGK